MATHDYVLDNASGAAFRTDLNNALAAIVSNNSNSSEPATKYAYQWWADTSNAVMKIRNSANNAWITLFTLAGGVDVDAASNFNEDVTFTGASANIVFDKSDSALEFADNAKAVFGTDSDLQIYSDNSNAIITASGAGDLQLISTADDVIIQAADNIFINPQGGESGLKVVGDGSVELYEDNVIRFETTSVGATVHCTNSSDGLLVTASQEGTVTVQDQRNSAYKASFSMGGSAPTIKNQNTSTSDRTLNIMKGTTTVAIFDGNGHLLGGSDNTFNLGEGSTRWGTVFAATGTINTSDKNEKNTIIESDLGLDFVNKLKPVSFKWNKDDGKTHYGLIVQDIEETITSLGKSVQDFGSIDKQKNAPMGLNYSELFAPLIKAVQELSAKVAALEVA